MPELILDCAYADGASGEAPDVETRATAIRIIIESVRRIAHLGSIGTFEYLENDNPAYQSTRTLRVTHESTEEINALWFDNVRLIVRESDPELFISRSAVAIRPGCHRGTILLDTMRVELSFDACEPSAFAWSLPRGTELDPDHHASVIHGIIAKYGLRARFGYEMKE